MAELIANGVAEANAEFSLIDGANAMLNLKMAGATGVSLPSDAQASVQIKTSDLTYVEVGRLDSRVPAQLVTGPATYRVVRKTNISNIGVDKS